MLSLAAWALALGWLLWLRRAGFRIPVWLPLTAAAANPVALLLGWALFGVAAGLGLLVGWLIWG